MQSALWKTAWMSVDSSLIIDFKYFKISSMFEHVSTFGVSRGHDDRFARGFLLYLPPPYLP